MEKFEKKSRVICRPAENSGTLKRAAADSFLHHLEFYETSDRKQDKKV